MTTTTIFLILASAILNFSLGAFWYSPALPFGKVWTRERQFDKNSYKAWKDQVASWRKSSNRREAFYSRFLSMRWAFCCAFMESLTLAVMAFLALHGVKEFFHLNHTVSLLVTYILFIGYFKTSTIARTFWGSWSPLILWVDIWHRVTGVVLLFLPYIFL